MHAVHCLSPSNSKIFQSKGPAEYTAMVGQHSSTTDEITIMQEALLNHPSEPQQRTHHVTSDERKLNDHDYNDDDDDSASEIPEHVVTLFDQVESRSFGLVVVATITYLVGLFHSFALRSQPVCISSSMVSTSDGTVYTKSCSGNYYAEDLSSIFYGMGLFLCGSLLFQIIPLIRRLYNDYDPVRGLVRTLLLPPLRCSCHIQQSQLSRIRDGFCNDLKELCATLACQRTIPPDRCAETEEAKHIDSSGGASSSPENSCSGHMEEELSIESDFNEEQALPVLQIV